MIDQLELQRHVLRLLADERLDKRIGRGQHHLAETVRMRWPGDAKPRPAEVMQAFWSLVGQGLAFIDMQQGAPENWSLLLSDSGAAALDDAQYNPNDPSGFMQRVVSDVPDLSSIARRYLDEAVRAYTNRLYLSSTVMLGVASEAAFLELLEAFATALGGERGAKFRQAIEGRPMVAKFVDFRRRLEPIRNELPDEFSDGLALTMDAVFDLLRVNRNDVGHPTGKAIDRDECFVTLQMAGRYLKKMYGLRAHFLSKKDPP